MIPKVMFVTPYYPPHVGGAEMYVRNLIGHLLAGEHIGQAVVVTSQQPDQVPAEEPDPRLVVHRLRAVFTISNTPVGLRWPVQLRRLIRQERPSLINAHAPVPVLADLAAAAKGSLPFVLTYHAGPMRKGRAGVDLLLAGYERFLLARTAARAARVVCGSEYVRQGLAGSFPGNPTVIRPGVDGSVFTPAPLPGRRRALFVGSLDEVARYKGLETLLRSVQLLQRQSRPISLDVVGDGDWAGEYRRLTTSMGLDGCVRFRGRLLGLALTEAFHEADVFVLPSEYDSVPTVVVEAMSCARPVVATRIGGIPEIVVDGVNGLLVPPQDPITLAEQISTVCDSPELARQMGLAGAATVQQGFTWGLQAAATARVFEDAIDETTDCQVGRGHRGTASPVRVAVVAPHYAPQLGGMESYARQVVQAIQRAPDLEAIVITTHDGRGSRHDVIDGAHVIRLGSWLRVSNTPMNPLWPLTVARQLRRHRVDVVNTHAPVPFLADVATFVAGRRPVVATYHAGSMVKGSPRVDLWLRRYENWVLPKVFARASARIAVSPTSLAWTTPGAVMVPPGVDLGRFSPGPPRRPEGERRSPTVLYVGRMERTSAWKGVDVLIRAFATVRDGCPEAVLHLVGSGDATADLAALSERLGLRDCIRLSGSLIGDDLVAAYRDADVVVLPSLTSAESFGMVLIEAMACGRPVIGSRIGGIPFVIQDGVNGFLVPPGDEQALALACLRVLRDPDLAAELGERGAKLAAERFSWDEGMSTTVDLLRSLGAGG